MIHLVSIILTWTGSIVIANIINDRQRMFFIPAFFAYHFAMMATIGGVSGMFHFVFMVLSFMALMVMCNGFPKRDVKKNPVVSPYITFFIYMFCVGIFGYHVTIGLCDYIKELMVYGCGFFMASWACRTEGALRRLLIAILVGAYFVIAYTAMHGGLSSEAVSEGGRAVLAEDWLERGMNRQNANGTALRLDCFLPLLLILFLMPVRKERDKFVRIATGVALVLFALMLIRTGSRGGGLALLPCAWYFLYSTRNSYLRQRRIALAVVILGALSVVVFFTMKNADQLRVFNFSSKMYDMYYDTAMDSVTSGRWKHYEKLVDKMTPMQKVFGAGFSLEKQDWRLDKETGELIQIARPIAQNYHSMFITVFIRTGFIGSFLFIAFLVKLFRQALRCGDRGRMALLLMGCWLLPGLGESWPMGGGLAILGGFAMGLVSNRPATNSELQSLRDIQMLGIGEWRRW